MEGLCEGAVGELDAARPLLRKGAGSRRPPARPFFSKADLFSPMLMLKRHSLRGPSERITTSPMIDLQRRILSAVPVPMSQGVLPSLLQQLSFDISEETPRKLAWMTDVSAATNPADSMIAMHIRSILDHVYQRLRHHRSLLTVKPAKQSSIQLVIVGLRVTFVWAYTHLSWRMEANILTS
ncbi:hypothetical protein Nepgr_007713 [Nepenthes gracilis]|uniref:Enhancer of mRNA-decapping protein 4 C-terminal domain-containing protein n=1 Tax=Nepenthes gracilis TaxID=150966 RepID=A0AAD3S7K4_NEPGR|nr:hypothetical protein Nepgr_007713 [Nepenthes gracilis]